MTDEQWKLIEPLLPQPKQRRDKRGRPWAAKRACFEGILWILQTGAAWRFLPILKLQAMITVVASLSNLAISIYLTRRLGVIGVFLGTIITQLLITLPVSFSLVRNLFIHLAEAKFESTLIEITDLARAACKAPAPNSRRHHFEQSLDLQEQMIGAALVIARDVSLDAIIAWNPARQVGTAIDNSL